MHSAGLSLGFWEFAIDTRSFTHTTELPNDPFNGAHHTSYGSDGHVPDVFILPEAFGSKALLMHTPEDRVKEARSERLKESNLWIKAGIARLEPSIPWRPTRSRLLLCTRSDAGVYHRQDDGGILIIILYVDLHHNPRR